MRKHVNYSIKNILPIASFTVGKLVAKFTETGSVHDLPRQGHMARSTSSKRRNQIRCVILEAEENPHHSTRQLALNHNVDHSFVVKLFKKEKKREKRREKNHPFKFKDNPRSRPPHGAKN
jgi:hypothetical protein